MSTKKYTSTALIGSILASIIFIEGEFSNDPYDPGGKTKFGITEVVAREYGYTGEMEDLSKEQAQEIYSTLYVKQPGFDKFIDINPAIAHKLIDAGVNVGTTRVTLWLQKALNTFSRNGVDYNKIKEDGSIGPATINAYKALEITRGKTLACTLVLKALDGYQTSHYISLEKYSRFVVGWIDKRVENVPLHQCIEYNLALPLEPKTNENK